METMKSDAISHYILIWSNIFQWLAGLYIVLIKEHFCCVDVLLNRQEKIINLDFLRGDISGKGLNDINDFKITDTFRA